MEKIKKLNIITGIIFIGFVIAVVYHFILGNIFHLGVPFNTFLFIPQSRFTDFTDIWKLFNTASFNPYSQFHNLANYFPFGMFFLYFWKFLPLSLSFLLFNLISIIYFIFYNYKNIKLVLPSNSKLNVFISLFVLSFLSYPLIFCLDRGNTEIFIFIILSLFVYFLSKEKYTASALMLSLPIAMKAYPLIFLSLFLVKKKFKEIFYCILSVLLLTFISLILMKGNILTNLHLFSTHMKHYVEYYVIYNAGLGFGSSLFGIVKFIIFGITGCFKFIYLQLGNTFVYLPFFVYIFKPESFHIVEKALAIFTPLSTMMILAVAGYVIFIEKEFWKQVALLFICAIIFTPVSGDYKLLSLFIPMWLFINSKTKTKNDLLYTILFGLVLIPKNYLQFIDPAGYNNFSISILLNPLILLLMLIIIIMEGFSLYWNNRSIKT